MVEVLMKGEISPKQITCNNCNSVLAYRPSEELYIKYGWDYTGDYCTGYVIDCPECHHYVFTNNGNTVNPKSTERIS